MLRRLSDLPRRVRLAGAAAVVAVLALGVAIAVVQGRAADAAERREAAAAALVAEQERAEQERAEREAAERAAAEREAARVAAAAWAASVATAQTQLAAADAVLAGSASQVADDGVRLALAVAMDGVRALLAAAPPGAGEDADTTAAAEAGDVDALEVPAAADLDGAVAAMDAAAAAVVAAQQEWLAAQAAAEAARQAEEQAAAAPRPGSGSGSGRTLGGPPSTGAGPDCGGPASYEPPKNDGPTFYTSTPSETGDGSNGRIPASQLSPLGWCRDSQGNQQWLRPAAAAALTALNEAFRAQFGENIAIDMTYRSYEDQVEMREAYGSIAARPGTSNHGTGLAFDTWEWQAYAFGSARYDWLVANGPAHGWVAPSWARQGGSNPEYWHFEYVG